MSDKIEYVGPIEEGKHTSPFVDEKPKFSKEKMKLVSNDCYYNGKKYSNGAYLCQYGELFQCSYGVWIDQKKKCSEDK